MSAQIVIDDPVNPPAVGSVDRAFSFIGQLFTLSNFDNTGVLAHRWTLKDRPIGSAASLSSTVNPTTTFTPDVPGTYFVELKTYSDAGATILEDIDIQEVGVRFDAVPGGYDWRIPAAGETTQLDATRGWATAVEEMLRDIRATIVAQSLQLAYDNGEGIVLDAQGAVDLTRGALCPDGEAALRLIDSNANAGRTAAMLLVEDANVGSGDGILVGRTVAGGRAVRAQVFAAGDVAWSSGLVTPTTTAVVFGDGDAVFGGSAMSATEKLRVVGDARIEGKLTVTGAIDPTMLVLDEQGGAPSGEAQKGKIVLLDVGGRTELHYVDDTGAVAQITSAGGLAASELTFSLQEAYADGNTVNVTGATTPPWFRSGADGDEVFATGRTTPTKTHVVFGNGSAVFGGSAMASTEKLRVVGNLRVEGDAYLGTSPGQLVSIQDGTYSQPSLVFLQEAQPGAGFYRPSAVVMGLRANRLDIQSPANDPATNWKRNDGVSLFSLGVANGSYSAFVTGSTMSGWQFLAQQTPGTGYVAEFCGYAGGWGTGHPLLIASRDITSFPNNGRVFQVDGDAKTTWTARVSPVPAELQTYRDDGAAGAADEINGTWTGYGKDSANNKQQFSALESVTHVVTSTNEVGRVDLRLMNASGAADAQLARVLSILPDEGAGAAERGARFRNYLAAGGVQFEWILEENSATGGPTFTLWRRRTNAPSANDIIGQFQFAGMQSTPSRVVYAQIVGIIDDGTALSEDGRLRFRLLGGGTGRNAIELTSPSGEALLRNFRAAPGPNFEFWLTEASATRGPVLTLVRDRATDAADLDEIGAIEFDGMDDGTPTRTMYARIGAVIRDSGDTSEDGDIHFSVMNAGTFARVLELRADGGTAAAERGAVLKNELAAGAFAAFELRAQNNFGAGQAVLLVTNNNAGNIPLAVDGDGDVVVQKDIEAVGGYKAPIAHWAEDNIASAQSNNPMDLWAVASGRTEALVAYDGSIVAISTRLSAALASGTLTIEVTVNGSVVFTQTITSADGQSKVTTQAKDTDAVVAGDRIAVQFDTDTITPSGSIDVTVAVYVEQ